MKKDGHCFLKNYQYLLMENKYKCLVNYSDYLNRKVLTKGKLYIGTIDENNVHHIIDDLNENWLFFGNDVLYYFKLIKFLYGK